MECEEQFADEEDALEFCPEAAGSGTKASWTYPMTCSVGGSLLCAIYVDLE